MVDHGNSNLVELLDGDIALEIATHTSRRPEAEAEIYQRFFERIRCFGLRHLGNEDAALDLVQEVMVRVIEKLRANQVKDYARIGSYILGTARNLVHTLYRRKSKEVTSGDHVFERWSYSPAEPDNLALDLLKRCLENLMDRERSILLLTYYGEQSSQTIAESFGLESGYVRVIRHRGMTNLRTCIDEGEGQQ